MRARVPPRFKPRKERPADVAWDAYFCSHRAACKKLTGEDKQEIINQMMAGLDPETALGRVLAAKQTSAGLPEAGGRRKNISTLREYSRLRDDFKRGVGAADR